MLVMSGRSAGSSDQQRCISCRSSSSGKVTFSQQGRSCSLKKIQVISKISCHSFSSGKTTFSQHGRSCSLKKLRVISKISCRSFSSGKTTFSQDGRSCSLKKIQVISKISHSCRSAAPPQERRPSHSRVAAAT